jgi:hypothetical protein
LCRFAPGIEGCLERPVLQPGVAITSSATLEPAPYVFEATVKDRAGSAQKTYTVNFTVE